MNTAFTIEEFRLARPQMLIYKADEDDKLSLVARIHTDWDVYPCNPWVDENTFLSYVKWWYQPEEDENSETEMGLSVDTNSVVNIVKNNGKQMFNAVNCSRLETWNKNAASVVGSYKDPESGRPNLLIPIGKVSGANGEYNTGIGLLKKEWQGQDPPFNVPEMKTCTLNDGDHRMGITGFCLDQKTCYINARPIETIQDDNETVLYGEEEMKIFKLDLTTMTVSGKPLTGHKGIPGTNLDRDEWMENFCPDASADYVACGSEANGAFLWDRHFGCLLKSFSPEHDHHHQLPQNGENEETFVRSVAIHRGEQDVMVTVGGHPKGGSVKITDL